MKPGSAAVFKFAVTASGKNFSTGNDVIIYGPWTSSVSGSGEEVLTSYDRFELFENSSETPNKFSRKTLLESDCRCAEKCSGSDSGLLSRSKRRQSETDNLGAAEVRDTDAFLKI